MSETKIEPTPELQVKARASLREAGVTDAQLAGPGAFWFGVADRMALFAAQEMEAVRLSPFGKRAADALADEVAALIRRRELDARSPAGDALLDYRDPPQTSRSDRLAALDGQLVNEAAIREEERGAVAVRLDASIDRVIATPMPEVIRVCVVASLMGFQYGLTGDGNGLTDEQIVAKAVERIAKGVK